jgi:hypothetical protein
MKSHPAFRLGPKGGRPPAEIRTACPVLHELFKRADRKGLTQGDLSKLIKRPRPVLSDWRRGKNLPNMFAYLEFAKALGLTLKLEG